MYRCGNSIAWVLKLLQNYVLFQEKETWADFIWASTMAKSGWRGSGGASDGRIDLAPRRQRRLERKRANDKRHLNSSSSSSSSFSSSSFLSTYCFKPHQAQRKKKKRKKEKKKKKLPRTQLEPAMLNYIDNLHWIFLFFTIYKNLQFG